MIFLKYILVYLYWIKQSITIMKKIIILLLLVSTSFYYVAGQSFVVQTPQEKNVVLEEFTGVNCQYCPDGHARAKSLSESKPGRVVLVMIHQGTYAAATPDYRTTFGDALASEFGVNGYPIGAVNRELFPEVESTIAMNRGGWAYAAYQKFPEQSPVNLGLKTTFDSETRELTVNVELFYTKNSPVNNNYIHVAFLQDSIKGPQVNGGAGNNYNHMHMLRHFITGQWGDQVTTTSQGTLVQRTYTWVVPDSIGYGTAVKIPVKIENCKIAAYVSQSHKDVFTAAEVPATGGTHTGATALYIGDIAGPTTQIQSGVVAQTNNFVVNLNNSLSGTEPFKVFITPENVPNSWSYNFEIYSTIYSDTAVVDITNGTPLAAAIHVTPGADAGLGKFTLTMISVNNPDASPKKFEVYVIHNITDLIVKGSGSWGDGLEYNFDQVFNDAMIETGCTTWANTNTDIMKKAFDANVMDDVNNIYLNIGWSFPTLTDDEANSLMDFMDNGGNVFMSGQDIGWDIGSGDGYGTNVTKQFFKDYIHAKFVNDGSSSNSSIVSIAYPFENVGTSTLSYAYGSTNFYPDQIDTLGGSTCIFTYNTATKKAGVRYHNDTFKTVYLGVGLEMLGDVEKRNEIFKITYDWFNGYYDNIPEEAIQSLFLGQNYPNPANNYTFIPVNSKEECVLELFEMNGRKILSRKIDANSLVIELNTSSIKAGQYFYRLSNNKSQSKTYSLQIIR